ncbi:glycine receptor subunit alpha-2-like [Liolophura sinensis]|uniref:glycine receptor subunit alpha-2-like n=1 Tax=Liolophura sinensis TaxID=3198878 RepID=UPI0031586580
MDFSINFLINQTWMDSRLRFSEPLQKITFLELDAKTMKDVWVPDLYFSNEKKADFHDVTVPNKLMHLYENGTIVYSSRITMTATCHMKLHKYPLDSQVCPIYIRSFTYTAENVILKWKCDDCVKVDRESELPQFQLTNVTLINCTDRTPDRFTCLEASFKLVRHLGYYVIQIYIPCVLIVMLSWVSFWLDIDSVPARISLGILTVLTMTTQNDGAQGSLPKVSYIKAIDVWSSLCLFFVFAALLEYSVVNYLSRKQIKVHTNRSRHEENGIDVCFNITQRQGNWDTMDDEKKSYVRVPDVKSRKRAQYIDTVSRVAFPATFLVLLVVYWIFYSYWVPD